MLRTDQSTRLIQTVSTVSLQKKSSKVSYNILLLSDATFFKLFFHIFAAIIESGAQVFVYPLHRMRPPAMLATSALHLSGHRRRQNACSPGISLGVGRGENHLAPNQGCTGGGSFVPT